jgi:predicted TIM-barrel enzyme
MSSHLSLHSRGSTSFTCVNVSVRNSSRNVHTSPIYHKSGRHLVHQQSGMSTHHHFTTSQDGILCSNSQECPHITTLPQVRTASCAVTVRNVHTSPLYHKSGRHLVHQQSGMSTHHHFTTSQDGILCSNSQECPHITTLPQVRTASCAATVRNVHTSPLYHKSGRHLVQQ